VSFSPLAPGFLPLADAALWAGVSPRTMKRWMAHGLPYRQERPRAKVLIKPSDIDAFLSRRQVPKPALDVMIEEVLVELQKPDQRGHACLKA
jgi:hypothetical protein